MGAEKNLYARIQEGLPFVHWQRFEDSCSTGIPDLNGCWQGREFWIEAKVVEPSGRLKVRATQIAWLTKRWSHGGNAWLLVQTSARRDAMLLLFPGGAAPRVAEGDLSDPWASQPAYCSGWDLLLEAMTVERPA